jgi:hypothetical protein
LVLFVLIIIHLVSIIVPIILSLVDNTVVQQLVYWIFNIISPSINAQAIITYTLAQKSKFCRLFVDDFSVFKSIGNDTIGLNWVILILHIIILLALLIAIDMGLLKFSFLCSSQPSAFDENILDNDVLAERRRILNSNSLTTNNYPDYLTVHDLGKRYRGRSVFAVNHLTFGAKRGEAFGLLGYNVSHIKKLFKNLKYKLLK